MGNPVTWFEINGPEAEQAAKFYTEVFGWHVQSFPEMNYHMFDTHAGSGIPGAVGQTSEGQAPHSVFYVENPDINALLAKAEAAGAKSVVPVTESEMVTFAKFADPFGNTIGLVKGDGTVKAEAGDNPPVDWFELSVVDPEKAYAWYRDLFGWKIKADPMPEGMAHGQIDTGQGIHGGIGGTPTGHPSVTIYAHVTDLEEYLKRAENLGGKTVMPAMQVDEHTKIAMFVDPQGTTFGLYATTD